MDNILNLTQQFIEKMNTTNSILDKKEILEKYSEIKPILLVTYNKFIQYYITSKNIEKNSQLSSNFTYNSIYALLNDLSSRKITGHEAIGRVNRFVQDNIEYKDVIYKIIDRDLQCRIGDSIINQVFPDFIPTFDVALAQSNYFDIADKINIAEYYASRKLDGCRCIIAVDSSNNIKFFSREGKPFTTLDSLREDIQSLNINSIVLDGEICIVDDKGKEDFQGIMKLIKRKDFTISNPKFKLFDAIPYEDFFNKYSDTIFEKRYENSKNVLTKYKGSKIDLVEQVRLNSTSDLNMMIDRAREQGWEGLILRKNCPYKGKRSNDILKIKDMIDSEYKVTGIETGPFRIIENGIETTIDTLTAVTIIHKGNIVSVGSGFSLNERKMYFNAPEKIIGKIITIRYFEETKNQQGNYSLRFPIFKYNHGDKREM